MPNPNGSNQFDKFASERKYGDVKKMEQLQKYAPMSGAPVATPAVNAPEKAQYKAVHAPQKPAKPKVSSKGTPEYPVELASKWAQVAQMPGASDIVKRAAERVSMYGA